MLVEANRFPIFQIPTGTPRHNTVPAIILALEGVCRYACIVAFLESDIGHWEVVRIFGNKRTPRTKYHAEVLRKNFMYVEILIDHLKFLGEAQELRIRKPLRGIHHHLKVLNIGNIARGVPAKEAAMERRNDDVTLEHRRIFIPNIDVLLEKRLVVGKAPPSLPGITLSHARSIWSA